MKVPKTAQKRIAAHPDAVKLRAEARRLKDLARDEYIAATMRASRHPEPVDDDQAKVYAQDKKAVLEFVQAMSRPQSIGEMMSPLMIPEGRCRRALDELVAEGTLGAAPIGAGNPIRYWS